MELLVGSELGRLNMSFKFNFSSSDEIECQNTGEIATAGDDLPCSCKEAAEIPYVTLRDNDQVTSCEKMLTCKDGVVIKYLQSNHGHDVSPTDLITCVYEGGGKIWEGSHDLTDFLSALDIAFRGMTVLEIGCGSGIPGLYAMYKGATVHFQDYNEEVLRAYTIPNVALNLDPSQVNPKPRFFSGDWASVCDLLVSLDLRYDVILTSETIYNSNHYKNLLCLCDAVLTQHGVIYVAAKVHYFGVGGGTKMFQDYVQHNFHFHVTTLHTIDSNLKREILEVRRKQEGC